MEGGSHEVLISESRISRHGGGNLTVRTATQLGNCNRRSHLTMRVAG